MSDSKNPVKRMLAAGEEKFQDMVDELLTNPRFAEALRSAIDDGVKRKEKIDRNVRFGRNLLNLPGKGDYDELVLKVGRLGESIAHLEQRLDQVIARLDALAASAAKTNK